MTPNDVKQLNYLLISDELIVDFVTRYRQCFAINSDWSGHDVTTNIPNPTKNKSVRVLFERAVQLTLASFCFRLVTTTSLLPTKWSVGC